MIDNLRDILAGRIEECDAARAAFNAASDAATRGTELVTEAEAQLVLFGDLEARIAMARGDRLAAWVSAGSDGRPPYGEDWLPDELAQARCERDRAQARVGAARAAAIGLEIEKLRASVTLRDAEGKVRSSVKAVLQVAAERIGTEYVELQRRAWRLRDQLQGYELVWLSDAPGDAPAPIPVPTAVREALDLQREPLAFNTPPPPAWYTKCWLEFAALLMADAAVQFDPRAGPNG